MWKNVSFKQFSKLGKNRVFFGLLPCNPFSLLAFSSASSLVSLYSCFCPSYRAHLEKCGSECSWTNLRRTRNLTLFQIVSLLILLYIWSASNFATKRIWNPKSPAARASASFASLPAASASASFFLFLGVLLQRSSGRKKRPQNGEDFYGKVGIPEPKNQLLVGTKLNRI